MGEIKKEPKEEPKEEVKSSLLEETKQVVAELKKEKEEIRQIRDEIQTLRSEQLLSGPTGAGQEPKKEDPSDKMAEEIVKAFH